MTDDRLQTREQMVGVTQADRDLRQSILSHIVVSLERPCSDGDMPDDRNSELDAIIARHRLAALAAPPTPRGEEGTCPRCNGVGDINDGDHPCMKCGGSGRVDTPRAEIGDDAREAITTLDVFLSAYASEPDDAIVNADDDLLTWGHLRTILAAFAAATPAPVVGDKHALTEMREGIIAGLTAFCSMTPDIDLSRTLKNDAADFILGQSGLFALAATPASVTPDAGEMYRSALERAQTALNDWLHIYADDMCDVESVEDSRRRIGVFGTIAYIADVQQQIAGALTAASQAEKVEGV